MAPKRAERMEARSVLTAVLLADSFTQRFRPITVERPKVLLPLVNVPMIEYTLEWLAKNKVEETYVFCCAHADQIKKYLAESKWVEGGARRMRVTTIVSTSCTSAGEALRIIDQRDIIKSDFILVSGDTVSNMNLEPALAAHMARRAADKNAIMTMVMKAVHHPQQRLRLGEVDTLTCLDPATARLLKYQEFPAASGASKSSASVKVDAAFFSERDNILIRTDLVDCQISICAPEVLMLFSDNFDYQNLKKDFVSGVLSEEELGNKLHVYELHGEYAAHVDNLRSFDTVSQDILQRWTFPFVPDTNVLQRGGAWGMPTYRYSRGHVYCEQQVHVPRSTILGSDVCIGAGTSTGEQCRITQTVIGRHCRIGKNVTIIGSYVHDNVTIQDDVVLEGALVCENAHIMAGASISPGAIISFGVVIGPGHRVERNKRLSLCRQVVGLTSLSDDELEYPTSTGHTSGGGGEAVSTSRRLCQQESEANKQGLGIGGSDYEGDEEEEEEGDDFEESGKALSFEKPSSAAVRAASFVAMGKAILAGSQEEAVRFDVEVVGPGGAGFEWRPNEGFDVERFSIAVPHINQTVQVDSDADIAEAGAEGEDDSEKDGESNEDTTDDEEEEDEDPETVWKAEVIETFLRCVKMRFSLDNVVIELNGLKIAEDRTFADCAKYIFTAILSLCLPAPPAYAKGEYASLFPATGPNISTQEGKVALLRAFKQQLLSWQNLLQRFLKNEDDQVEVLLTFEEFCSEDGVFEKSGEKGSAYTDIFPQVLKQLYDLDVVSEEALLAWAAEKEHADESEKVFLAKASEFIAWLKESEDEDEDTEDEED